MENHAPNPVDEYIATFPSEIRERMEAIRSAVHAATPGVEEKISWAMPTFSVGKKRFHFAGFKHHIGIYPGVEAIEKFATELAAYKTSKGGIQLPYEKPLPVGLITQLAAFVLS